MPEAEYEWRENLACIATYKILEQFLDEFDDVAFEDAAALKVKKLRFFPKVTTNPNIIRVLAIEKARNFLRHLVRNYVVTEEDKKIKSAVYIRKIAAVLGDGNKTVKDLAEVVDGLIKFEDEA